MTERSKQNLWLLLLLIAGQVSRIRAKHGLILCFHRVLAASDQPFSPTSELAITPTFLDRLLAYLRRRNIAIVSLHEALNRVGDHRPFVCFTFDDGYRDNFEAAFPIFLRHQAPFAIFLTTGFIDRTSPMWWAALEAAIAESAMTVELPDGQRMSTRTTREKYHAYMVGSNWFRQATPSSTTLAVHRLVDRVPQAEGRFEDASATLTWDMVRQMVGSGLVTFGCHTVSHPTLSGLDAATIREEIVDSRNRIIDELGVTPVFFAYPYGNITDIGDAPEVLSEQGFCNAFTTYGGSITVDVLTRPFWVPRISWNGHHQWLSIFDAHSSGLSQILQNVAALAG